MPESPAECTARRVLTELGCANDEQLTIDSVSADALARRYRTPLYVFSSRTLQQRVTRVQRALGNRAELLWSVKANPSVAVTSCLRLAGTGAEIASLGELEVALAAGHDAQALRFAGPGKSDRELRAALVHGLGTFHVESLHELNSLARLAQLEERQAGIAIRVNLPQEMAGARMRMGGRSSRFGIDVDQVPAAVRTIEASSSLCLRGLHVYGGTQCFDADAFVAQARALAEQAATWERELDVRFDELDVGGGFGVAVFDGDPEFDLEAAGIGLRAVIEQFDRPGRRWFVELGRYLAGPAGVYLTRVVRDKTSGGLHHAVLDGGMHQAAAAAGLGTIVRRPPLLVAAQHLPSGRSPKPGDLRPVTLGGPLCTPMDQFTDQIELPPLQAGDLIAVLNAGAYGLTYSPTRFLSHALPAEVLIDDGEPRIVRERGEDRDVLLGQCW